ncbi:MAG: Ig-like domain repeat protein [Acidobacteriaceae bacterium]|nr:Ig-like domain repeat protein [Acidobacteriaceae bacterium]
MSQAWKIRKDRSSRVPFVGSLSVLVGLGLLAGAMSAHAQGLLTVTPARSASTVAGTGTVGFSGDGASATGATLASPSAVAYDAAGNLYIADANNHVIREVVKASGAISTIAGTGVEGYDGDGGAATSALLDTPTGIAVDASGNVYIADSHNQRIRKVSAGVITTIAGTGVAGFSGDGAAATAATLNLPSAVAVSSAGVVYIADTDNQRVRQVSSTGVITTIAGTGDQGYTGDGAAATAAALDSPTGVAIGSTGIVYVADSHNQRVRAISAAGTMSTLAGSGTPTFSGDFGGDGASSTAALLAKPTGVSVDANGNVYVADTNNQRVRQLGGGVIQTVEGSGGQGFGGDGGVATAAVLNAPKAVGVNAAGDVAVVDTLDQRVRGGLLPTITFGAQGVGVASAGQAVTVANTGTAAITVSSITFTGTFQTTTGGTCSVEPISLAAGASCTQNVAFLPTAVGAMSGSVIFGGTGVINQTILLAGTAVPASTTTTVTTSLAQVLAQQSTTFTAQVLPAGLGTPTGTVQFYANGTAIGGPVTLPASGLAALTTSFATSGSYAITAIYSGDANFLTSTSTAVTETVADYTLAATGTTAYTVQPNQSASYTLQVAPLNGAFNYPVTFAASGVPVGTTVTFSPTTVTPGSAAASVTMTLKAPPLQAALSHHGLFGGGTIALALLLLPFGRRFRRSGRKMRPVLMVLTMLGSFGVLSMAGCSSGFFAQSVKTYTVTVTSTALGTNGATLQHTTQVTLTVE